MKILSRFAFNWRTPAGWLGAFAAALVHTSILFAVPYRPETAAWLFPLMIAAPGLLTMILVPAGFRRWYRWAAILGLTLTTYADSVQIVLFVAETWALHRQWVTEPGGIRNALRFRPRKEQTPKISSRKTRRTRTA